MKIILKKGLDIPLAGKPSGAPQILEPPRVIALNLDPFDRIRFHLLCKVGDKVNIGQPLAESKSQPGKMFVSPGSGTIKEIRRGLKRRLLDIIIEREETEHFEELQGISLNSSREELLSFLMKGGAFPFLRMRPFNLLAKPHQIPRDIFVSAYESLPTVPPAEMQVDGHEEIFQIGLDALSRLTSGKVHLVHHEETKSPAFLQATNVEKHTIRGPHPAGSSSVHIHFISPIKNPSDIVWTASCLSVLTIGKLVKEGRFFTDRIIGVAGNGILENKRGFFKGRMGFPLQDLLLNRCSGDYLRFISGDPLVGTTVEREDFLGFYHTSCTAIPERISREPFHFFRLGFKKYTATKAYLSGHMRPPKEGYPFTTNQHGEERAFIDPHVYEKVMPMKIPTMHLIKAILAEDFETAEKLGLLEVEEEDFALPAFICPSKIEMIEIVKEGLDRYSKEMGF